MIDRSEPLFKIHDAIEFVLAREVDVETGEITDETLFKLDELELARDDKALAVAAYLLGERAEAKAVKEQADRLAARARAHKARADRLLNYLRSNLPDGLKLSDARVQIGWRRSTAVEVDDDASLPDALTRITVTADKTAIKEALKAGEDVPGARLVTRNSVSVR